MQELKKGHFLQVGSIALVELDPMHLQSTAEVTGIGASMQSTRHASWPFLSEQKASTSGVMG